MKKFLIFYICINIMCANIAFATDLQSENITPSEKSVDAEEEERREKVSATPPKEDQEREVFSNLEIIIPVEEKIQDSEEKDERTPVISDPPITEEKPSQDILKPNEATSSQNNIRINEVLPNPDGTDSGNEFIEIYNDGDESVSLLGWYLYDKTGTNTVSKRYQFDDITIKSHEFITLYNKANFSFAINNSDETIILEDDDKNIISEFSYKKSSSGLSWNYDDNWYLESPTPHEKNKENPLTKEYPNILINEIFPNPKEDENQNEFIELYNPTDEDVALKNWILRDASQSGQYVINDTVIPAEDYTVFYRSDFSFALNNSGNETISLTAPNSKILSSVSYNSSRESFSLNRADKWYWHKPTPLQENHENPLTKTYPQLLLSEILPNPSGNENTDEFIEIYNPNDFSVDLEFWTLQDASTSGSFTFIKPLVIKPLSYYTIYRKDFLFALNNSNEKLSFIAPNEKVMSQLSYISSREDISHNYNLFTKNWRQSKYLTPGKENIFNNLPIITKFDIDDTAHKNVYAEFEARASDSDNEKLNVRWDFGDGHKSYKWDTRHKYTQTGIFYGSLRIQDESEEIIKNFTVTVKKYPKHQIVITKIVPNPAGKDSGNEYIVIKNKSKKKINLKNWSIATGAKEKTLVNHPIYDDLYIKSGKTKIITKKYAAISLPNKTGALEIRRPNSSVSHAKKYGDKNISIPDNASYEKIDGIWQWITPIDIEVQEKTNAIIAQALQNETMFSQKLLEQKIAHSAIYDPQEKRNMSTAIKNNSYISIFEKINKLLNTLYLSMQKTFKDTFEEKRSFLASELYTIQDNPNPCDTPHITTKSIYNFCK